MKNTNISVKKHQSYLVLLFALLICGQIEAKVNNYVGAYASVAEWSLMPANSDYSTSFGATGGLGFLYELQAGPTYSPTRFLMDVGLGAFGGASIFSQSNKATLPALPGTDSDGDNFDFIYEINSRKDAYNTIALQVPLMVGVQHKAFYMLAGVKLHYFLWTQANASALVTTYGHYDDLIGVTGNGDLRDLPAQQFISNQSKIQKSNSTLNFDLDLSFEIGGRIGIINEDVGYDVPKRKIEYRLAAFVDYGLMDVHQSGTKDMWTTPGRYDASTSMINNLVLNDIMSTRKVDNKGAIKPFADKVNSFMFGLKFTVLFQMPEPGQCVICRDAYTSSARRFGRARMKYEE